MSGWVVLHGPSLPLHGASSAVSITDGVDAINCQVYVDPFVVGIFLRNDYATCGAPSTFPYCFFSPMKKFLEVYEARGFM